MRRLFCLASVAALLAGCATVGPDFKSPAPPTASGFAMKGDAPTPQAALGERLAGDWWALFRSPEIDQTVRAAVAGNRSLEAARQSLAQARDAVAAQAPQTRLDASASLEETRVNLTQFGFSQFPGPSGPITLENPTFTSYSFGLNGSYDLDLFGQRRREHERLLATAEAQVYQADAAYLTLTAQVVGQAIAIAGIKGQITSAEAIVAADQANLDLVTKAFKLGGGTRLDVATIQTELAADEAQITPLRQQLSVARHALALLVGQPPSGFTPPEFDLDHIGEPDKVPVALPSDLVRERPDIRAAEGQLHSAIAQIGVAEADLYPKVTLTGNIAQGAMHPQDLFSYGATGFALGPGVTLPILGRGQLHARTRMAEDAARGAFANYQQVVLAAFTQVADSLQAINHDNQAILDAERELAASSDQLRLQRMRYEAGKTPLLPVLDAQRSYARASMSSVRARAQRLQDTAALLYATSRNWNRAATTEPQRTSLEPVATASRETPLSFLGR
jgi:NodT family efflux transporter outer membrane factor (OMF) lipoprotein